MNVDIKYDYNAGNIEMIIKVYIRFQIKILIYILL
jgi:hypothetical protein